MMMDAGRIVGMGCSERSVNRSVGIKLWLMRLVPAKFRRNEFRALGTMKAFCYHHTTCAICLLSLDAC
jgi:hypothetical protein